MTSLSDILGTQDDSSNRFIIVGKETCVFTKNAVVLLVVKNKLYSYVEYSSLTPNQVDAVNAKCEHGYRTFPRVFYNERFVGGFTELTNMLN